MIRNVLFFAAEVSQSADIEVPKVSAFCAAQEWNFREFTDVEFRQRSCLNWSAFHGLK